MKRIFYFCILVCFFCTSCRLEQKKYSRTVLLLGTVCTIQLFTNIEPKKAAAVLQHCVDRIETLDTQLSANAAHSMLTHINDSAGGSPIPLPEDIFPLFERAAFFAKTTHGAFNPVIGPVVKLWNIGFDSACIPNTEDLSTALLLTNYTDFELNEGKILLKKKGMKLDLGAIAKGFIADEIVKLITAHGVNSALIDIGGTITALGKKQNTGSWIIGIRDPRQQHGNAIISIEASNKSVATSGVYERFFIQDGIRYHHIIDPKTGYPVKTKLLSVSIISDSATDADALSTACFVLGYEKSLLLLTSLPNTEALFIFNDNTVKTTPGIAHKLNLLNADFHIVY